MASFFSGWIGYGAAAQAGALQEPTDSAYVRRPIEFSALENGLAFDIFSGTVGPSSSSWGVLRFAGLFDAPSLGNLLLTFPLFMPITVGAGATYTTGAGANVFFGAGLGAGSITQSYPAGTAIGATPDGREFIANLPLQVSGGILSAQSLTFGATITMATLPAVSPASGSGQLWNNGGIVAVA